MPETHPEIATVTIKQYPVWARIISAPESAWIQIAAALTVERPQARYSKAHRYGHWDGKVRFLQRPAGVFLSGLVPRVATVCKQAGFPVNVSSARANTGPPLTSSLMGVTLKDFQLEGVGHVLQMQRGGMQSPTGSGKLEMIAEIIRRVGKRTLVITASRGAVMRDTAKRLQAHFPNTLVGCMGDTAFDGDAWVLVGMVPTLSKISDPAWWQSFEMLILDEAHHAGAETWYQTALKCTGAIWRIAFSGTLLTKDPVHDMRLEGLTGPSFVLRETMSLVQTGDLPTFTIRWLRPKPHEYPQKQEVRDAVCPGWRANPRRLMKLGTQMFEWDYQRGIVHNTERNNVLIETAILHAKQGDKVLLLLSRIDHVELIATALQKCNITTFRAHSQVPRGERDEIIRSIASCQTGAVLVSAPIFREGMNIPELDVGILGGGGLGDIPVEQAIGRLLRGKMGKILYDVLDGQDPLGERGFQSEDYLSEHTRARIRIYRTRHFVMEGIGGLQHEHNASPRKPTPTIIPTI